MTTLEADDHLANAPAYTRVLEARKAVRAALGEVSLDYVMGDPDGR